MQIKIFTIPTLGGEMLTDEMNVFLRSKKILQIENQLQGASWCFCIKYLDDIAAAERDKQKVDYMKLLDAETFKRFSALRVIRKRLADEEGIRAYIVFTDAELAEMAKMGAITPAALRTVQGIGEKKVEKYGHHFYSKPTDEKG